MEDEPLPAGHLRFVLRHFHIHPDRFTESVGLVPTWVWLKGERRRTPKGRAIGGVDDCHKSHSWSWSEDFADTSDAMEKLSSFVALLERHRGDVAPFVEEAQAAFLTIDFHGERHSGFALDPGQLRSLADLGIAFGAECFP